MEDEDKVDSIYLKGFNEGYTIAQNMPELAQVLDSIESKSERLNGLKDGQQQYFKDQAKELKNLLPGWLKDKSSIKTRNSPTKSKDRDLDKD